MITLIGVGHVFQSRAVIEHLIGQRAPQVVGVELDRMRYEAMLSESRGEDSSLLMKLLVWAQNSIAKSYGADVGEEMLSAIDTALELDLVPVFIDMPADKAAIPLFDSLSLKNKLMIGGGAVTAIAMPRRGVEKALKVYEENPGRVEQELEKHMPLLKKVLVDDRNKWMANEIIKLNRTNPDIVAVVGDAHVPGILKILKKAKKRPEVIRLGQIRDLIKTVPKKKEAKTGRVPREKVQSVKIVYHMFDSERILDKYGLIFEGTVDLRYRGYWKEEENQ